ncbi:MAG: ABC transporter ATP-binding protein, partial [Flavobacteriales bacterium]
RLKVAHQQQFMRRMRVEAIQKMAAMDYADFVKSDVGALQNVLGSEINRSNIAYNHLLQSLQFFSMAGLFFLFSLFMHAGFAITVAVFGSVIHWTFVPFNRQATEISEQITQKHHYFHRLMVQMVRYFPYLRVTNRAKSYGQQLVAVAVQMENEQFRVGSVGAKIAAIREPLVLSVAVGALLFFYQSTGIGLAEILVTFMIVYRSAQFAVEAQTNRNHALGFSASAQRVEKFLNTTPTPPLLDRLTLIADVNSIQVREMLVHSVSEPITAEFKRGQLNVITGASGKGKTTLLRIIAGTQTPLSGKIMVNDQTNFYPVVGYVSQEPAVFSDTLRNNLSFWESVAISDEDLWGIMKRIGLEEFCLALPDKLDTLLDPREISGGEAQRIAIAREIVLQSPVILLDEPTAALDDQHAKKVVDVLQDLSTSHLIIVVSHQPEYFKGANFVNLA